jgi:hypothetical protein
MQIVQIICLLYMFVLELLQYTDYMNILHLYRYNLPLFINAKYRVITSLNELEYIAFSGHPQGYFFQLLTLDF